MNDTSQEHSERLNALAACPERKNKASGAEYGCVGRHSSIVKELEKSFCDYRWNGFDYSKDNERNDLYSRDDHLKRAIDLGYATEEGHSSGQAKKELRVKASELDKDSETENWVNKFNNRFRFSLGLLRNDKAAFHVDHTIAESIRDKFYPDWLKDSLRKAGVSSYENFKPRSAGGAGCLTPYYHNYHHMIPNGVVENYVIYAESDDVEPNQRISVIIASMWNINRKENVILLPQDMQTAKVVSLPAHCPYGARSHQSYSTMVESKMKKVVEKIDESVDKTEDHEVMSQIKDLFKNVEDKCLKDIRSWAKKMEKVDKLKGRNVSISHFSK